MHDAIVGRNAELAAATAFVERVSDGAAALAFEGEAGMGKTTLWEAGVAEAEARGFLLLLTHGAESEVALSFSGLGDLLDSVLDDALAPLPVAQRRALSRALLLDDEEGPPPDPHAVGVAVLNVLRALAADRAIVVAIDDVQWLDAASAGALVYAARRLRDERVGVLLARRSTHDSPLVVELRRSLPPGRFSELEVGPLHSTALHQVVHGHLRVVLPRPLLAEVRAASGGNPFYALEIVRTLQRTGVSVEAGQPLPVPESLHDLVHGRLLALPRETREFLAAAAAHAHPQVTVVEQASGVARQAGLVPSLEAGIIELHGSRVVFTHPLLAAGAYETVDPLRRAEIHARLAELLDDPEARAWQLASSVDEPDEVVAIALEEAARHAHARGAPRPAALLLERAGELTPADHPEDAMRRTVDAAYFHFESGDSRRAEAQLRDVVARVEPGRQRARALARLARVRSYDAQEDAVELFLQAIGEAESEQETLALAHDGLASCLFRLRVRLHEAVEHAATAGRIAVELEDESLAAESLGTRLIIETLLGMASASDTSARALELQGAADEQRVLAQPLFAAAVHWWWTDEVERARAVLVDMVSRAGELGDESSLPYVLVLLGRVECLLGDLRSALTRSREGQQAAVQSGQDTLVVYNLAVEGLVLAHLGSVEHARRAALEALERAPATGGRPAELVAREALGDLELALGAPAAAADYLAPAVAFVRRERIAEPAAMRFVVDWIESSIEIGAYDEASELLDWYEGAASRLQRASALAACRRCRGLLAAAIGRIDEALGAYEDALAWHERVGFPLDRGRTLLALGATQRRLKRRREARATLEDALGVFERIGAALWADRARAELKRISGRAATPGALTPAEERVAALVAEGKTNREVAAALFLSERTVEGHLSHVFGKLGIRHRAEVTRALDARQTQGVPGSNTGDTPVSATPAAP